jgi:hypothetical protein
LVDRSTNVREFQGSNPPLAPGKNGVKIRS